MAYLAQWRLKLGRRSFRRPRTAWRKSRQPWVMAQKRHFNRAFKREFDCPPAQFRRQRQVPSAQHSHASHRPG